MSIRVRLTAHGARTDTAQTRVRVAADREVTGVARDQTARRRDLRAEAIEQALADSATPIAGKVDRLRVAGADARALAAPDRARAAKDRADVPSERERLAAVVDQAADGIVIVDAELRVTYANAAFTDDLGGSASELVGRSVLEVVDGVLDATTIAGFVEVAKAGQPWLGEADRRLAGGTVGRVQIRVTPRLAADLTVEGYVVVIRDVTELRQAERAAQEHADRYRSIVDGAAEGIYRTSREGRILAANPALAAILGYDSAEALVTEVDDVGRQIWADADDRSRILRLLDERDAVHGYECRLVRKDGTPIWVSQHVTVVRGVDGQARYYDGFVEDVTVRHETERAMRRLSTAIEQSSDAVTITDASGAIQYVNPAFEHSSGYTAAEVLGQNPRILKSGVQSPAFYAAMWATLAGGRSFVGDLTNRRKDGALFQEEAVISPIRDEAGAITSYVAVKRDVTERKRLETERSVLAAAVEQAADFVIVVGPEGNIESVNPAFERLTGHSATAAVGRPIASLLRSGVDPPEVYAALDEALRRGEAWSGRLVERRADGGYVEVDLSVSPIRDATGALIGSVEIGRDRAREREMEAEREREAQIRVALAESLATIPDGATLEQAAQAICDELVRLPFIDVAEVEVFLDPEDVEILTVAAPPGYPASAGTRLPMVRASIVRERSTGGPWAGYVTDDPASGWIPGVHAAGLRALAYGPIMHGGQVGGAVVLGTFDEAFAHTFVEQMPGLVSFSATSSALLGERMHARRMKRELRAGIAAILAARPFHPVFQPIVDLETGEKMGYEALTRFDSGQRPDLCFADAWSVGLGDQLELATLEAAVAAAKDLPAGTWLDLNVSPRLLADPGRLREILRAADRALVLEVTEHELIGDYEALRTRVRELGRDIRVAVDDAGAGVANFGHIIDLRPDFVKLDISLVRRVNANLGRQAMVVGMRHFARTAGCRLVAEGIETEDEATTLRALGVEFGQGYLYGHPGPVADWTAAGNSSPEADQLRIPHSPAGAGTGDRRA